MRRTLHGRARERFFNRASRWTNLVSVEAHGLEFVVPTWDDAVGRRLFVRRTRGEMSLLPQVLKMLDERQIDVRSRLFVDVGANVGTTSLLALRGGFTSVIALEPEPANAKILQANACLNGLETRIDVIVAAASDIDGVARLELNPRNSGGHRITNRSDREGISVRAVRLETLLGGLDVGLLWLDVQGHEEAALRGAGSIVGQVPIVAEVRPSSWTGDFESLFGPEFQALDLRSGSFVTSVNDIREKQTELLFLPARTGRH